MLFKSLGQLVRTTTENGDALITKRKCCCCHPDQLDEHTFLYPDDDIPGSQDQEWELFPINEEEGPIGSPKGRWKLTVVGTCNTVSEGSVDDEGKLQNLPDYLTVQDLMDQDLFGDPVDPTPTLTIILEICCPDEEGKYTDCQEDGCDEDRPPNCVPEQVDQFNIGQGTSWDSGSYQAGAGAARRRVAGARAGGITSPTRSWRIVKTNRAGCAVISSGGVNSDGFAEGMENITNPENTNPNWALYETYRIELLCDGVPPKECGPGCPGSILDSHTFGPGTGTWSPDTTGIGAWDEWRIVEVGDCCLWTLEGGWSMGHPLGAGQTYSDPPATLTYTLNENDSLKLQLQVRCAPEPYGDSYWPLSDPDACCC